MDSAAPSPAPLSEFRATRRVEFNETDLAGIVHFANFFRYMETVEHAFWRALGTSVVMRQYDPPLGLPRVHASCDYRRPLCFEDVIEMHLLVTELRARTISFQIRFNRLEPGPVEEVARGKLTAACVLRTGTGVLRAVPFPHEIAARIAVVDPARLGD